ncbi:hypothetical protein E2P81_ATG01340 [Venturia nashicola]|uniref:Uncharacterized protein n=1 Tax=Venturia nashicola TaxID=86259 RepID=A0A4Z1PBX3_9PEZI|nr:hypothetical protein E6O75_ATG01371 [Venturia nashicola]TLD38797.1 hypothetical protein E2P81_ATG01340 [Venturia nashicola]
MGEEQSTTMAPQGDPTTTQSAQLTPLLQSYHQVFPFLKLPRELRDNVYRSVLIHDCHLFHPWYFDSRQIRAETQIFRVNQQIYDEAREIFLAENVFEYRNVYNRFGLEPNCNATRTPRYEQERKLCALDAVKNARHVRAKFRDEKGIVADFINLLAQNQHLRSLELNFAMRVPLVKIVREVLPKLEVVKVRDSVVFKFVPRLAQTTRSKREFEEYLKVLKEKMLAK